MSSPIDDAQAQALLALHPWARGQPEPVAKALQALLDAERCRRGQPEPVSGALHLFALTQGTLLAGEYDLSTHAHWDAWEVGALLVDVRALILVNDRLGFLAGDAVLRQVAATLSALHPRGKVVRIHGDAFAVLLPPSAETPLTEALRDAARPRLEADVRARLVTLGHPVEAAEVGFTLALLRLQVSQPSHPQLLGPLTWAECERALTITKRGGEEGVQVRRISLEGAVPLPG